MKFEKSSQWLKRAKAVIPSASQTYSKSYKYFCEGAAPAFLAKGQGSHVWDVDGNEFIDFVLGLGAVTVGYNHDGVNRAIAEQLKKGISFSQSNPLEVELAEKLVEIIPCAEMVRFVKNGSDATAAAVRLARAFTSCEMIACAGYHGFHDWYIGTTINNRGVPQAVCDLTQTFEYNNIGSLESLFQKYPGLIAAVILEPVVLTPPQDNFLQNVKDIAHANGAVVIFDETVTGFRLALGGAQQLYNVVPDMATFGKGIANGMPLSVLTGRRDIMQLLDEGVFVSLTFGGETLSLAAGLATISILEKKESIPYIWSMGEKWLKGVSALIQQKGLTSFVKTAGLAPHAGIVFSDHQGIAAGDWQSLYQQEMIANGILTLGINNYCLSHTPEDLEKCVHAVDKALEKIVVAAQKKDVCSFLKGGKIRPIFKRN